MSRRELTKNSVIVFSATAISSGSAFVFQIMMGRAMPLELFGALNAILSIQLITSVLTGALILSFARYSAEFKAKGEAKKVSGFYDISWVVASLSALGALLVFLLTSPFWKKFLGVGGVDTILTASILVAVYFIQSAPLGFVRGTKKFFILAVGLSLSGILKIVFAGVLIYAGVSVARSLLAIILSVLVSIIVMHLMIKFEMKKGSKERPEVGRGAMFKFCLKAVGVSFFPLFFVNIDMIMVRSLFGEELSGYYAAFSVIGKTLFILSQVIAVALFPAAVSDNVSDKLDDGSLLKWASMLLLIPSLVLVFLCYRFPEDILQTIFNKDVGAFAYLLPYYVLMVASVSMLLLESNYRLAKGEYKILKAGFVLAVIQLCGLVWFSESFENLIIFQTMIFGISAFARLFVITLRTQPSSNNKTA